MTSAPPRPGQRIRIGGVGESAERPDGVPKVTGEFAYASDLHAEHMLHGQTLRSPHAHARILSLDTRTARAMPGVRAVLTSGDIPGSALFGLEHADQPALAIDRVRYAGEPVAIVAAEHPEQARAAVNAIRVTYETLPAVTDPIAALRPDAPVIHDHGNVIKEVTVVHGDPEARGEIVVEGEYEVAMQGQAALGPEAGLATPDRDGGVTLQIATQWLHVDRDQIAACLGLPKEKVRLILAGVGGAFGAREDVTLQIHVCMLALATKRPVRMTYGREESFSGHVHRHPARLFYRHTATRDGRLVSVRATIVLDGGAYASSSGAVVANAACFAAGPYRVPNALVHCVGAYTNNPPTGAMRGFGAVQSCFAYEAQMDELAKRCGLAPVAIRALNGLVAYVHTAAAEVGQGIVSICAQIARTELGIERVEIEPADTTIDSAGSSSASRQTWMTGSAVMLAARQVREELERRGGDVGAAIEKTVVYRHRPTELLNETAQNHGHVAFLFAAHRAVVDVDRETGLVKVVQVATSQDVGKALNPLAGIAQGLGLAVMEEVQLRDGKMLNASFTDYLLPTILDMPPVVADVVEHPHPDAPYGAKGVGEPPTISSTPAIVAAIRAATGRVLNRVPIRPDDIVFGETARSGWRIEPGADPRSAIA